MKNQKTKNLVLMGMICAIAYALVFFIRIPLILFLKYEPKDIIITIGGFILGPVAAIISSVVVSLIEMITISDTGFIGLIMNILSTCGFALPAAIIYKKKRTTSGAIIGLVSGIVTMAVLMLLWNYIITPLYMPEMTREAIVPLLTSAFLPFNLIKGILNAAGIMLIYKPLVTALRKANLIEKRESNSKKSSTFVISIIGGVILAVSVVVVLILNGVIKLPF